MRVTDTKDKIAMIAAIIDPQHFTLWSVYLEARLKEGRLLEEALKMTDYNYAKDIQLAYCKAQLILKLLDDYK